MTSGLEIATITVASIAIIVSSVSFYLSYKRGRKTEQIKLCIDISSRIDDAENKIFDKDDELKGDIISVHQRSTVERTLRDAHLLYLNHWEFFAFLVNIKEINDEKILDYYKPNFNSGVKGSLDKYPKIRDDKKRYEEIKKLLRDWDPSYYSLHFGSR